MGETLQRFWEQRGDAIVLNALQVALIVALLLVARWLGGRVIGLITRALTRKIDASERRQAQINTVSTLLNSVLSYGLLFVGLLSVLGAVGVNLAPVLATAGVTGLAISLGAQQIVRDVLNGFFILVEDQFAVGDEVTIDGVQGVVETMGMRITRIRDAQGRLITLANSSISRVTNHSRGRATLSLEVSLAADYGLDAARAWLERACAAFTHPALQTPLELRGPITLETARYTFQLRAGVAAGQLEAVGDALRAHLLTQARAEQIPLA
ncbi:MAG: mechanosensitive ion channel domain-containing protein [Fimbriimonadales bacterium]|nr:MAG: mechanosensitive ion channel protein MscS [Fimbriimonadales bacterium]